MKVGRPKSIKTPEQLHQWFDEYIEDTKSNPFTKVEIKGNPPQKMTIEIQRPLTWNGFYVWLYQHYGITNLAEYRSNSKGYYSEYSPILKGISKQIEADQIEGALVGIYKQGIIARKLNIADGKKFNSMVIKQTNIGFE